MVHSNDNGSWTLAGSLSLICPSGRVWRPLGGVVVWMRENGVGMWILGVENKRTQTHKKLGIYDKIGYGFVWGKRRLWLCLWHAKMPLHFYWFFFNGNFRFGSLKTGWVPESLGLKILMNFCKITVSSGGKGVIVFGRKHSFPSPAPRGRPLTHLYY